MAFLTRMPSIFLLFLLEMVCRLHCLGEARSSPSPAVLSLGTLIAKAVQDSGDGDIVGYFQIGGPLDIPQNATSLISGTPEKWTPSISGNSHA